MNLICSTVCVLENFGNLRIFEATVPCLCTHVQTPEAGSLKILGQSELRHNLFTKCEKVILRVVMEL
jgi:hypothetical protein